MEETAIGQNPKKHVRRFKETISKHKTWFNVVGAAVVLLTFIANEVLRDTQKDWAGEMSSLTANAEMRFSFDQLAHSISELNENAIESASLVNRRKSNSGAETSEIRYRSLLLKVQQIKALRAHVDVITDRYRRIAEDRLLLTGLPRGWRSDIESLDQQLYTLQRQYQSNGALDVTTMSEAEKLASQLEPQMLRSEEAILKLPTESAAFSEETYRTSQTYCYVLFSIGWSLNLIGALLGVNSVVES